MRLHFNDFIKDPIQNEYKNMKKLIRVMVFAVSLLLSVQYAFAAPHHSYLYVTIINDSENNYLYLDAETKDYVSSHQNAVSKLKTSGAFFVKKTMIDYSGFPPTGSFRYKNQLDNTICSFRFDSAGVTLVENNNHCSVNNEEPISTGWPLYANYRWNATITIN
jgi:hypothetical protein